jgi:hypothetical protein
MGLFSFARFSFTRPAHVAKQAQFLAQEVAARLKQPSWNLCGSAIQTLDYHQARGYIRAKLGTELRSEIRRLNDITDTVGLDVNEIILDEAVAQITDHVVGLQIKQRVIRKAA